MINRGLVRFELGDEISTENLIEVTLSLYLLYEVYEEKLPVNLHKAPRYFDEYTETGATEEAYAEIGFYDVTPKPPGPILSTSGPLEASSAIWVNLEVPLDYFKALVNGEEENNGFMLCMEDMVCSYQNYASRENENPELAPKLVLVYGTSRQQNAPNAR